MNIIIISIFIFQIQKNLILIIKKVINFFIILKKKFYIIEINKLNYQKNWVIIYVFIFIYYSILKN